MDQANGNESFGIHVLHMTVTLGPLGFTFRALFGIWPSFGTLRVTLASLWAHFTVALGVLWRHFGVTLRHFGATLCERG